MTDSVIALTRGRQEVRGEGSKEEGGHFSIVTYNILADCHMRLEW